MTSGGQAWDPSVSPDGRWVACFYAPGDSKRPYVALVPFDGGPPAMKFEAPPIAVGSLRWRPDGQAVAYAGRRGVVDNLWGQPVAGGEAVQLTDYEAGVIRDFDWSHDGTQLAVVRAAEFTDLVMLRPGG